MSHKEKWYYVITGKWMELEIIMLKDKSSSKKPNIMFSLFCGI
jgi:hypothetical protein